MQYRVPLCADSRVTSRLHAGLACRAGPVCRDVAAGQSRGGPSRAARGHRGGARRAPGAPQQDCPFAHTPRAVSGVPRYVRPRLWHLRELTRACCCPGVSVAIFAVFTCTTFASGDSYLDADARIMCYDSVHKRYMGGAAVWLVLVPFGVPAFFLWLRACPRYGYRSVFARAYVRALSILHLQSAASRCLSWRLCFLTTLCCKKRSSLPGPRAWRSRPMPPLSRWTASRRCT